MLRCWAALVIYGFLYLTELAIVMFVTLHFEMNFLKKIPAKIIVMLVLALMLFLVCDKT